MLLEGTFKFGYVFILIFFLARPLPDYNTIENNLKAVDTIGNYSK